VWEVATGKELLALTGHQQEILCVAFSPDGKRLASGSSWASNASRPNVKVWDAETGKEVHTLGGLSGEAFCVAFSPDGKRLAVGTRNFADQREAGGIRGEVRVWDVERVRLTATWRPHGQGVNSLAFRPDGKQLALGLTTFPTEAEACVKVCDAATGRELRGFPEKGPAYRQAYRVAFSPDGKRLAATLPAQKGVKVWDAEAGKLLLTVPREGAMCVAFSPDGKRLAVGDGGDKVTVWDVKP
jgi:WD40 repeat protein